MLQHVVMMSYTDAADDSFMAKIASYTDRVRRECAGIVNYAHCPNVADRRQQYTHAVVGTFESHAAHEAYQVSPAHQEMKAYMAAFIVDLVACDTLIDQD
ncbi:MAG: Dabb family protein [Rhodobacteraceae bacterium]|nr:Dabb family protein [Paracoccaceae bacterium]